MKLIQALAVVVEYGLTPLNERTEALTLAHTVARYVVKAAVEQVMEEDTP